jgi:hypothetical protein
MKRRKEGVTAKEGMKDDFLKQRPKGLKCCLAEENAEAKIKVEKERQEMFDSWNAEVVIPRQEEE